MGDLILSS